MAVMYITRVPNRNSPPAVLLRESYRDGAKTKNRTLANLSRWPDEKVEALARVLKGLPPPVSLETAFEITRSRPHGHVAAVLGTLRSLGIDKVLDATPSHKRDLVLALVVARVLEPAPKLATARALRTATRTSSLGEVLAVSGCDEDDLYEAMDWLLERQEAIERRLARRHLKDGTLVLYDVSSAAFEGSTCPLGAIGHARDGVKGRRQIVYGLMTTTDGIPVAIETFAGNTADPATLWTQVEKLKQRFGLSHVALVGDRGMITTARISEELAPAGLDWITALRAPAINVLAKSGAIQLSLFDDRDLAEISHPDYPGERLVVCRNPNMTVERRRKREALLTATERALDRIVAATRREKRPLHGAAAIGLRVGRVLNHYKVGKHFRIEIGEDSLSYQRNDERIAEEAALDGLYVLRTSIPREALAAPEVVSLYKRLENVERVFRGFNSDLDVRPIHHRRGDRVRAHLLLCMLGYYVMWHMAERLAPILFRDHDRGAADRARSSPVASAVRSAAARSKASRKRTESGQPVHSFSTLLKDLATIVLNDVQPLDPEARPFQVITNLTELQTQAFHLLAVSPRTGLM
jgi:hypothetical protein